MVMNTPTKIYGLDVIVKSLKFGLYLNEPGYCITDDKVYMSQKAYDALVDDIDNNTNFSKSKYESKILDDIKAKVWQ